MNLLLSLQTNIYKQQKVTIRDTGLWADVTFPGVRYKVTFYNRSGQKGLDQIP